MQTNILRYCRHSNTLTLYIAYDEIHQVVKFRITLQTTDFC